MAVRKVGVPVSGWVGAGLAEGLGEAEADGEGLGEGWGEADAAGDAEANGDGLGLGLGDTAAPGWVKTNSKSSQGSSPLLSSFQHWTETTPSPAVVAAATIGSVFPLQYRVDGSVGIAQP